MKRWILFCMLASVSSLAQAEIYRWVDARGRVHYSDTPPPPNVTQVERRKSTAGWPAEASLPYALQQAVKNFPVTLYTSECGDACRRATQLLSGRGIPYTEMDASDPVTQEELKKLIGANLEVPVLKVGRSVLRGIEEGQWNSTLDAAGYPQTAQIPPRPPKRPPKPAPAAAPETPAPGSPSDDASSR